MKKRITLVQDHCDQCGAATHPYKCLLCNKDYCYECTKKFTVTYPHAVHFAGSGDGIYCIVCDAKLLKDGKNKLHNAYVAIHRLRFEEASWCTDFKARMGVAEETLRKLQP